MVTCFVCFLICFDLGSVFVLITMGHIEEASEHLQFWYQIKLYSETRMCTVHPIFFISEVH